jgi:hypothetical protein
VDRMVCPRKRCAQQGEGNQADEKAAISYAATRISGIHDLIDRIYYQAPRPTPILANTAGN